MLQQELDKTLETLERERTELEARLREQQTETEALRAQREEERTQADSALYQVSSWSIRIATYDSQSFHFPVVNSRLRRGFLKGV